MVILITSEIWLGKSLEIAFLFLPHDTPLVGQILNVYNSLHSIEKTPIVNTFLNISLDKLTFLSMKKKRILTPISSFQH